MTYIHRTVFWRDWSSIKAGSRLRGRSGGPAVWIGIMALSCLAACSARTGSEAPLSYRQGEDAFRLADYDRAARAYRIFIDTDQREDLVPRAYYRLALAEVRIGHPQVALDALDELERRYPKRKWPQVYEVRGDIEDARGNDISAVRWWELGWEYSEGRQKDALQRRITDRLARMDATSLAAARSVLTTAHFQEYADARVRAGGPVPAQTSPPRASKPQKSGDREARERSSIPPQVPVDQPLIGCLLPQTGRFAPYGQRSLNGIRLALGADADRLVVRDTQGEPHVARAALDEFIANPRILAVIGPLRSKVAGAVAARAERAGLPLVVLSQLDGLGGHYVTQPSMTSERQAAEIAEYAVRDLGLTRLAVLYSYGPYGAGLSEAFATEVRRRGGQIVGTLVYGPEAQEFSAETLSVQKWVADQGLQGVFIPDSATKAVPLALALRNTQPGLVLLGSNGWYDPAELARAGRTIDGAVFVDGFFAASQRPATRRFVAAYQQNFQSAPEIFEAQAYDAALLVKRALDSEARTRGAVAEALRNAEPFEGASGSVHFGAAGAERGLFLLRVGNGAVTEVERAVVEAVPADTEAPAASSPP